MITRLASLLRASTPNAQQLIQQLKRSIPKKYAPYASVQGPERRWRGDRQGQFKVMLVVDKKRGYEAQLAKAKRTATHAGWRVVEELYLGRQHRIYFSNT